MNLKYEYDDLVIGNDLEAIYFAFQEGFPIVFQELEKPHEAETMKITKPWEGGNNKKIRFESLIKLLAFAGLVPFGDKVGDLRIEGNKVYVSGKLPWVAEITTKRIHNFTNKAEDKKTLYKVVDYINTKHVGPHEFKIIKDEKSKFVKEIKFCPSRKIRIIKGIKALSILTKKQLESEDYSPVYSRLKVKRMMLENGIIGAKKGFKKNKGWERQRYRSIILEFVKREVSKINLEEDKVVYDYVSKNEYINKLVKLLWKRRKKRGRPAAKPNTTSIWPE